MPFNIGQLRRNDITSYTTPVNYTLKDIRTTAATSEAIIFIDKAATVNGDVLDSGKSYYLSFKVNRLLDSNQIIKVYLRNSNQVNNNTQILQTYTVIQGDPQYAVPFELVFTPNTTYTEVVFELQRDASDYAILNSDGTSGRKITLAINTFSNVLNILTNLESSPLKRIGVQGPPGLIMCINGEEIHVGRSGIYELNVDIDITFLGFVLKQSGQTSDGLDFFVMDYQY